MTSPRPRSLCWLSKGSTKIEVLSPSRLLHRYAWLLAAVVAPASVSEEAVEEIQLAIEPRWGGHYRSGAWLPLTLTLENRGDAITGQVVIESGDARLSLPVDLPSPSRKSFELYLPPSRGARRSLEARLSTAEGEEVRSEASLTPLIRPLVVVVGDELRSSPIPRDLDAEVIRVNAGALPELWKGYESVTGVVIDPEEMSSLRDAQRRALEQWALVGGNLWIRGDPLLSMSGRRFVIRDNGAEVPQPETSRFALVPLLTLLFVVIGVLQFVFPRNLTGAVRRYVFTLVAAIAVSFLAVRLPTWLVGGSALVRHASILHVFPNETDSYITTRTIVRPVSRREGKVRSVSRDSFFAAKRLELDEHGRLMASWSMSLGSQVAFDSERFAESPFSLEGSEGRYVITNRSASVLQQCGGDGDETRDLGEIQPHKSLELIAAGLESVTCTVRGALPPLAPLEVEPDAVESESHAVVVFHLGGASGAI